MKTSLFNMFGAAGIFVGLIYGCVPCRYETATGVVTIKEISAKIKAEPVNKAHSNIGSKSKPLTNTAQSDKTAKHIQETDYVEVVFDFQIDSEFEKSSTRKLENQKVVISRNQMETLKMVVGARFRANFERITQGTCAPPTKPFSTDNWQQIE